MIVFTVTISQGEYEDRAERTLIFSDYYENDCIEEGIIRLPAWRTREGKLIPIKDMTSSHIINCIRMIERSNNTWRPQYLDILKEELSKRNHSSKNSDEQFEKAWNSKMAQLEMKSDTKTQYTWVDKDENVYPVFITKKGSCYIFRTSKKTGKEYKQYLPKSIQKTIKQELNR